MSAPPRPEIPPSVRISSGQMSPYSVRGTYCDLQLAPARSTAADLTQQQAGSAPAQVVAPLASTHGQGIYEAHRAAAGGERGFQHHGLVEVPAISPEVTDRTDRPVPGIIVKQTPKDRRAVESWEAQPLHRSVPADQGGRMAVGQQCVICDRSRAHVCSPSSRAAWRHAQRHRRGVTHHHQLSRAGDPIPAYGGGPPPGGARTAWHWIPCSIALPSVNPTAAIAPSGRPGSPTIASSASYMSPVGRDIADY